MKECPFIERSKKEYESELGPKLILIAEKPLDTDKAEIFDSAFNYLTEVFKSRFKSAETHITYITDESGEPFARNMFFNILGHYVKKGTLDPKQLAIAFVGKAAFEVFKKDYLSQPDMGGISIYLNEAKQVIKPAATWLNALVRDEKNKPQDILIPYIILPNVDEEYLNIKDQLNDIPFDVKLDPSPYCDTNQIITKLEFLSDAYKDNLISHFVFEGKINGNKIEYFSVYDEYTKIPLRYCPRDELCANDSQEQKEKFYGLLKLVLTTIPVIGDTAKNLIELFSFKDQIKLVDRSEVEVPQNDNGMKFEITGDRNGSEPSEWYHKWYKEVFEPLLKPNMRDSEIEREGYDTKQKYEWIYDIEVFHDDWLFVAKTLDGKNRLICWNDPDHLRDWIRNKILIGFNNAAYDDVVIKHAISYPFIINKSLTVKKYSDALIMHGAKPSYPEMIKGSPLIPNFLSWDISFHGPFDIRRNSLKKLTMSVLNKRNYDSSVSFDTPRKLTPKERLDVEKYCEMDVDNTLALFMPDPDNPKRTFAKESYDIRWNMIVEYKMRAKTLINKSSSFAGKLLCGEDAKANIQNTYKIVDGKRQYYSIPELAMKELCDENGKPSKLLQFYLDNQDNPNYITEKFEVQLGGFDEGHKYQFGFGGLHQALIGYRSKNLVNMDVASLYPSLLVEYGLMSRGAAKNPESYKEVYHTRLKAKKEGKTLLNQGLKLILNGAIGAMLSAFNPLYDTWSNSSICVHGQLLLFILVKRLYDAGFNIIQTNTDGIMIERQEDVDFMPIAEQWMKETRLVLEFDEIDTLAQNNVNNYYCKFTNGKVKSKGFYLSNEKFGKATSKILCNMVTDQPLLDGVIPRDFVLYKKHAIGEIYDGKTNTKVDGRSLAFVVGYPNDPRTQAYYSRSKNARKVAKKDENGNPVLDEKGKPVTEIVHTISKITGFNDHMLLVDDLNTLTMDEINTMQYIAFAKNLLNDNGGEFGPYYTADYEKVEEPDVLQALNNFKDNTAEYPTNSNLYCQNLLFECDDMTKEEQEEQINKHKDLWYRVVWSGNKSYHCVVKLSHPVTATQYKNIWLYIMHHYQLIGCDEQANVPSKYTRVPGMINPKTNEEATLYSYDKNVLDADAILDDLPRIKNDIKPFKEYKGKVDMKALERHIKKLDWGEGNRFNACQKLSPRLISQVPMEELLKMIPDGDCLDKDHRFVIRNKYKYYEKHKYEIEKELENK